jgi:CheY-like chemotaxis protein
MEDFPTIVLVEDEDQQREALTMLLEVEGYKVQNFSSAEDALKKIGLSNTTLFISDIKLTGMDGFAFFEGVRSNPTYQNTPFIFISAYNDMNVINAMKVHNHVDYITKPYDLEDFITAVKKYLPSA